LLKLTRGPVFETQYTSVVTTYCDCMRALWWVGWSDCWHCSVETRPAANRTSSFACDRHSRSASLLASAEYDTTSRSRQHRP